MKFSYTLIKKIVPGLKNKNQLIEALNEHSFEVVDAEGDSFDVSVPPNRFSDAASHWGIAREISAILNLKLNIKEVGLPNIRKSHFLRVEIKEKKLCRRYIAEYFTNVKIKPSPVWMQKILKDCGLRPINNVVDIMNYVMLETGQPLHAFDFDKIESVKIKNQKSKIKNIIIRTAKHSEEIKTLDNQQFILNADVLVIADSKFPLAIAGVKGGKKAEVDAKTKNIIVEAANFDGPNIYRTSKFLNLKTDASLRFSHSLSPFLAGLGLARAGELLIKEGARPQAYYDSHPDGHLKKLIEFNIEKFNHLIGVNLSIGQAEDYLKRLGFLTAKNYNLKTKSSFLVEVPQFRADIENSEDLAEEISRLYGYNKIKSLPPEVPLKIAKTDDIIVFKDQLRKILTGFGASEVYNYSFVSATDSRLGFDGGKPVELLNPISPAFQFLRPNLAIGLLKNIKENFRFFEEARIFEIGKVFNKRDVKLRMRPNQRINSNDTNIEGWLASRSISEGWRLGIAIGSKNKEIIFELKGLVSELLKKSGLVEFFMRDGGKKSDFLQADGALMIESDNSIIGYLGKAGDFTSVCEIDLEKLLNLVEGELEFRPLPKYPSVMRDISILVSRDIRIGEILEAMNSPEIQYVDDVDLIDEYFSDKLGGNRQSLTFRVVFRSEEKTLEDREVDKELVKIVNILKEKFMAEIR
ncbi:MAG: phenylalanine--tRNA ligase subunit beta [Candidatus Brennerbacteria bacterium]|nr:phenylalanine--tRNA ligase subunit beta [Candidatus Brennerbacteria bacterium]